MTKLSTRVGGRRPRSAKARNRGSLDARGHHGPYGDLSATMRIVALGRLERLLSASREAFAVRLDDRIGGAMTWRGAVGGWSVAVNQAGGEYR
jgi:hypothetical protein